MRGNECYFARPDPNFSKNHFHIYLNPPTPLEIGPALLLAANPLAMPTDSAAPVATLQTAAQGLLDYAQTLTTGDELMFTMDMPSVPAQYTPIVLAQAAASGTGALQPDYILKDCQEAESIGDDSWSAMHAVDPASMLGIYIENRDRKVVDISSIKTTLLKGTTHGEITSVVDNTGRPWYRYDAEPNYVGNDQAVFMAEYQGKVYKIVLELHVFNYAAPGNFDGGSTCPKSTLIKVNGKPVSGSLGFDSSYSLNSTLNTGILSSLAANTSGINLTFANLTGGAVGQDVGNNITLDTNAAGNGWFIDATPADNSEFLATSNPNEWVAKAGSAAAGKMDMLSVLLHEYGHALGIDHSTDPHDFMGTTLTVGVRRLPSPAELALMQQLIAEAKNGLAAPATPDNTPFPGLPISLGGLAFAGLLRPNRYGGTSIDALAPAPKYDVAANAAFTNLNTASGWNTQGSVDVVNATATLNEVSTSQTRLSQVFMVGAQDRYLSFTLAGSALDNPTGAPQDAFEVALLDANTGLSVLGTDGMTRTYRVDLTGVAKNTAVNLSFDLLGFGAANSHVTLRDVRVSGLPQLHDDVATLLEDGTLAFDPFAQADAALRPMLASSVVNAPTHGAITVNADGTFSYKPDANYNGADSFSYRLSDGPLDSNLATVSLTVTSVNDAPTGTNATVTTLENAPYVRF